MTRLMVCLVVVGLCLPAHANPPCASAYRSYSSYSYAAPYVAKVQQFYYVGAPIRVEAMVQAEMRANPDYQEFQSYQQFKGEFQAFQQWRQQQQASPPPGAMSQTAPQSQLQASCVRCHSGPEPKGGRDFSGPITADDLKAIKEILPTGKMPPASAPEAAGFSNELAGSVILNAIDQLDTGGAEPIPPPPPQPPTNGDAP